MSVVLIIVHILVCIFLIAVILLQAGRGQGLSNIFGGGAQELFGAKTPAFLAKTTAVCATLFLLTSLSLSIISRHQRGSLMDKVKVESAQEIGEKVSQKQGINREEKKKKEEGNSTQGLSEKNKSVE
ncbi:MAG: preprotein translocase subunit SecG [Candidatus Omnitrophota bacterium]|nr:MAG: preprotein translocase subunit SecG [Candidatus Omnitrophota bacterium]